MFTPEDFQAISLTLSLATVTTVCLLFVGLPLAWWLSHTSSKIKPLIEAIVALPLVLPPTVIGFYLLIAFSPDSQLMAFLSVFGIEQLSFTFAGLVIGSCLYSLPFVVQPLQASMLALDSRYLKTAQSLGVKQGQLLIKVILPMIKPGLLTACVLGFAHTVGEFGVILMIGGSIPGETKVVSIAIYEYVEIFQYDNAHALAALLLGLSLFVLSFVYYFQQKQRKLMQ